MKRLIIIVMVILFAVPAMAIAKPALESAEIEVLNKWLGIWKFRTTLKPAAWSLKAKELSGTSKVVWILDKKFQEVSSQSDEHEIREIHHYDAPSDKYHKWAFTSDGGSSFWIGSWDEESSTMEWVYIDFGFGITGKIVDRFTSGVKYESALVMKDGKGNVLLDTRSEYVRSIK